MSRLRLLALMFLLSLVVWHGSSTRGLAAQERESAPAAANVHRIAGTVVNALNNLPLGKTYVTIALAEGGFSRTVTTTDDGRFLFDRLRGGKYSLSAERRGFASQGYEEHEGRFSTAIVVGPELDAGNLTFRIVPDASFSGRITDDRDEPVRNARVMLLHELMVDGQMGKRIVANTSTDDRGHYHFAHLKPGAYYIGVSARPWYAQPAFGAGITFRGGRATGDSRFQTNPALDMAYPLTFYPNVTDSSAAGAITLGPGDRASADFTLRAVPALHVRINIFGREQDVGPRRSIRATLVQTILDGIEIPMQTGMRELGNTVVMGGVPPGHYLLRFNSNPRRAMEEQAADDQDSEQPARERELDLVADTDINANEMPAAAMISGIVKLPDGQPPKKPPIIELRRGAMRRTFNTRVNANGEFAFPQGFAMASYEVWMSSSDDLHIRSITATGARTVGRMLHISGSDPVKLNIVVSAGAGKIEGLALRDGKPQSGVMILLVPQRPESNLPLFRRDQSDSDGSFTLSTVLPGRYTLLALEKGWDMQWGDPALLKPFLAGGETIVIEPKGTYKVRVSVQ